MTISAVSTASGNHLVVSLPSPSLVRASTQEFPVHLSSKIDPETPAGRGVGHGDREALLLLSIFLLGVPLLSKSRRGREREKRSHARRAISLQTA